MQALKVIRDAQHSISLNIAGIEREGDAIRDCKRSMSRLYKELELVSLEQTAAGAMVLYLDTAISWLHGAQAERTKKGFIAALENCSAQLEKAARQAVNIPDNSKVLAEQAEAERLARWQALTPLERWLENERFILKGHEAALAALKAARVNYCSELVMMKAIESCKSFISMAEGQQAAGQTEL